MPDARNKESAAMRALLRLVSAGARGEEIKALCVELETVLPLAAEQKVLSLVACALLHSPKLFCPPDLREYLLNAMRAESSANLVRRQRIMRLLREMKSAGIEAKVLKGYAVSECYAYPECRGSLDTDLLIEICQESQAISFLEDLGFRINTRSATSHHAVCQHKKYGMVELHVALYDELAQEVWFRELKTEELLQETVYMMTDEEGGFYTLGHTDQLIFLTLHMVKHFIIGGLTLRMMLDVALHFAKYRHGVDSQRYWSIMKLLHYDEMVSAILWNMVRAGAFRQEEFPGLPDEQPEQMTLILADLEQGGYMGVKEKDERIESGMEYNRQLIRKHQSAQQYRLHMLVWKIKSGMKYMFPSMKRLKVLYPIITRHPVLMPFLWFWQIVSFPVKKIRAGVLRRDVRSETSKMSKVAENRIAMFKKLGML